MMLNLPLTTMARAVYAEPVAPSRSGSDPTWVAGLDILKHERQGAHTEALFLRPLSMAGHRGLFGAPLLVRGMSTPMSPPPFPFDIDQVAVLSSHEEHCHV